MVRGNNTISLSYGVVSTNCWHPFFVKAQINQLFQTYHLYLYLFYFLTFSHVINSLMDNLKESCMEGKSSWKLDMVQLSQHISKNWYKTRLLWFPNKNKTQACHYSRCPTPKALFLIQGWTCALTYYKACSQAMH